MGNISLLYIGRLASESMKDMYANNCKHSFQFAAQNLQEAIIEGFVQNDVDITVLATPYLSTYPIGYKKLLVKSCDYFYNGKVYGKSFGYVNLPLINVPCTKEIHRFIEKWYKKSRGEKVIFVYSLDPDIMRYATWAKKRYDDVKIVIIVPDLLRYMGMNNILKGLGYYKSKERIVDKLLKSFDGLVVLTEAMIEDLNIKDKPYIVMEGIFSQNSKIEENITKERAVLYTGNIDERYGIRTLLDAFSLIEDKTIKLWIRGNGSTKDLVLARSYVDKRIQYINQLSRDELIKLQHKAQLLINPVSDRQEFTKFFFPSKTMDYLASGTPVLMYELECIPKDYKPYLYFIKGYTPLDVANSIQTIIDKSPKEKAIKSDKAKDFILENKTPKMQISRVVNFFNTI